MALVAGTPDEPAIIDALQEIDPELRLHQHADTSVLQIRDREGWLLATLEPGQLVECSDGITHLLGPEIVAGLPEMFWWVETRARPDARGREVARRFADGLALRLGGAVWTSGEADFGLWREAEHPAVERTATRALLVAQDRRIVPFSSWLSDAVATHAGEKMLQVLTPSTSRLTYGMRSFLAGPLGRWVVRGEDGGYFDGLTGVAMHWDGTYGFLPDKRPTRPSRAAEQPDVEPVPGFLTDFGETAGTHLTVDVSVLHDDPSTPLLGRAVEVITEQLAKAAPSVWGPHEPALRRWDREHLVGFAHQRKPQPWILYLSGPSDRGHPFSGQIRLSWRGSRVLERASVVVGFEKGDVLPSEAFPTLVEALAGEGLLEGLRIRRLPGLGDATSMPVWTGPAVPVGLAIGPERLRRIGTGSAQSGPIKGTLIGEGLARAAWYPVLEDAAAPMRALALAQAQTNHLAAASRR